MVEMSASKDKNALAQSGPREEQVHQSHKARSEILLLLEGRRPRPARSRECPKEAGGAEIAYSCPRY